MAEYTCCYAPRDKMRVEWGDGSLFFKIPGPYGIRLALEDVRRLRDQINEHLKEPAPQAVVGTIVTGNGLTEAQKKNLPNERNVFDAISALQNAFNWGATVEGDAFWRAIDARLKCIRDGIEAEKRHQAEAVRREKEEKRTEVGGFVVQHEIASGVRLSNDTTIRIISSQEARDLAAALTKHADAAEKKL